MRKTVFGKFLLGAVVILLPLADLSLIGGQALAQNDDEEGRRAPPAARSSQTL